LCGIYRWHGHLIDHCAVGIVGRVVVLNIMTLAWDEDRIMGGSTKVFILAVDALTAFGFGASV
jgi:hypothetical protein